MTDLASSIQSLSALMPAQTTDMQRVTQAIVGTVEAMQQYAHCWRKVQPQLGI